MYPLQMSVCVIIGVLVYVLTQAGQTAYLPPTTFPFLSLTQVYYRYNNGTNNLKRQSYRAITVTAPLTVITRAR